jgi:flagellar protein FliS
MQNGFAQSALKSYGQASLHGNVHTANPHQLIEMLLTGAMDRISRAKGQMQHNEVAAKCDSIGKAVAIIDGLRASLDKEVGGQIAANLDQLYDYMGGRLVQANARNETELLDEVAELLGKIRSAWVAMPRDVIQEALAARQEMPAIG